MRFLVTIIVLLICGLSLLGYLVGSKFFKPINLDGDLELWNIFLFLFMLASNFGLLVSLVVFVAEKLLYCGKKEFPSSARAIKIGVAFGILLLIILVLHIFHFLNVFVVLLLLVVVIIGIMLIR